MTGAGEALHIAAIFSMIGAYFGMNFAYIPLLQKSWGIWAGTAMMVISALIRH